METGGTAGDAQDPVPQMPNGLRLFAVHHLRPSAEHVNRSQKSLPSDQDRRACKASGFRNVYGPFRRRRVEREKLCPGEPRAQVIHCHPEDACGGPLGTCWQNGRCALQDLTPKCLEFLVILGTAIVPSIQRSSEMIRTGVLPRFNARYIFSLDVDRLCLAGRGEDIDVSTEVFVWYKNRLLRPQQFLALYQQVPVEERFEVLTFQDPHFRSVETDANALVNAFFRRVSNEMHNMLGVKHDCTITMTGTDLGSLNLKAGWVDPQSNPGYSSSSRGGWTAEEWREYNSQWTTEEWEEWRAVNSRRQHHYHRNRAGWGWNQYR